MLGDSGKFKNYPRFSWDMLRPNQKDILRTLTPTRSFIFKTHEGPVFSFLCKHIDENQNQEFEVYTIPDNWLVGTFVLEK